MTVDLRRNPHFFLFESFRILNPIAKYSINSVIQSIFMNKSSTITLIFIYLSNIFPLISLTIYSVLIELTDFHKSTFQKKNWNPQKGTLTNSRKLLRSLVILYCSLWSNTIVKGKGIHKKRTSDFMTKRKQVEKPNVSIIILMKGQLVLSSPRML